MESVLATRVTAGSGDGFEPGLLYLMSVAAAGVAPAKVEKALLEAVV